MVERDFEEKGRRYTFDPHRDSVQSKFDEAAKADMITSYLGPILGDPVLKEISAWAEVLMAIKDGIPKPYDSSIIIDKITRMEKETGEDFSELKNCCPPSGDVREAIQMKPFIFGILDRIIEIGEIQNYVNRYNR